MERGPAYVVNPRRLSFFHGEVLLEEADCREFLAEVLERAKGAAIRHTRLVYRYDGRNRANVHLYADGRPDLLFVGCTAGGSLLAGYSEVALAPRMPVGGCALLASLTNRKVFPLAPAKKALTYDPVFLIFGNSELRVSADRPEIYSNFGVTSGVYVARGEKVDCLLGEGQARETPLQNYELHQVIY